MISTTTLKIEGMTCQHCAMTVTRAIRQVAGVESAAVDLKENLAVVTGEAEPGALIKAVEKEGYHARLGG